MWTTLLTNQETGGLIPGGGGRLSNREGCSSDALKMQTADVVTVAAETANHLLKKITFLKRFLLKSRVLKFKNYIQCVKKICLVSVHAAVFHLFIDGEADLP